ncbi:hypothetical protein JOQ06_001174, partial [Pogonophryne albipinna]
ISKEALYGSHSPVHTLSASSRSPLHSLQGSMSPPMVRSMPSSPSRRPYGGSTGSRTGMVDPGSSMLPGGGRSSSLSSSSSAILERRDVKPDEDLGSSKALVVRGEGGPHFPDSYCSSLQDGGGGGRFSFSSSQCSAPPSLPADMVDAGIPGGLQQYRASVKPLLMGHGDSLQTRSLHRQKSRKFGDSQLPSLGTKTPPPSPHRVNEVRMIGGQIIGGVGLVSPERMSPIRRSLRQDSNGAEVEIVNRSRGSGSSSSTSSVFLDSPLGQPERLLHGHVTNSNPQSERMKAMEEQIASLTGLVHSALSMGSDVPAVKALSENAECKHLKNGAGASPPEVPVAVIESVSPAPPSDSGLQQSLVLAKRHVCDLRLQLNQLRHLQLSNQESLRSMLRMAGEELVVLMCDGPVQSEEAANRRLEMEQERIHYLTAEERTLKQLQELEDYVERLQRSSAPSTEQLSLTLREVEDGAVNLWRIGEALALLKGEFPELQGKLRSVLRLEVEAVRFLKEEPHKMESMLKRVRALTEALSCLRRCVSESTPPATAAQVETLNIPGTDQGPVKNQSPQSSPKPQPRSSVRPAPLTPSLPGGPAEASPVMARRMNASTSVNQPPHHQPSPPLTPTHGRDSPSVAKVSPRSRESSPALQRRPLQPPTQGGHTDQTAERRTPEGSLSVQTLPPATNTHCDQDLQEAQASLMQSVPAPDSTEGCSSSGQRDSTVSSEQQEVIPPQLRECVGSTQLDARDSGNSSTLQHWGKSPRDRNIPSISPNPGFTRPGNVLLLQSAGHDVEPPPPLILSPASVKCGSVDLAPQSASQLVAVAMKPPPSAPPSASPKTEHSSRPQVEKPRRTSVDKAMKQSPDRGGKSPPPPPTRRFHAVSSGLTTGSSREDDREKKPPGVPQPKPWRQPPEVKPKPTITIPKAPTHREEEEEDDKLMKELQVTKALSGIHLPGGNKQWNGEMSQVANQKPSMMAAYDHQSAPQPGSGDSNSEPTYVAYENQGFEDSDDSDKKAIIVIMNEPMDIQSAYKRLSTIFESEEHLDKILSTESVVDEDEFHYEEDKQEMRTIDNSDINTGLEITGNGQISLHLQQERPSAGNGTIPENQDQGEPDFLKKPETKRMFKFKFPKNKLSAISKAIRTGTTKTGKKTLEVVVYEEEEEIVLASKSAKETKKQTKESKRSETSSPRQVNSGERDIQVSLITVSRHSKSHGRAERPCNSTLDSIDSLEESIKQLEISADSMAGPPSPCSIGSLPPQSPDSSSDSTDRAQSKVKRERERSLSKRPASQVLKVPNPPQSLMLLCLLLLVGWCWAGAGLLVGWCWAGAGLLVGWCWAGAGLLTYSSRPLTRSCHTTSSSPPEKAHKGPKQPGQAVRERASQIPTLSHSSGKHPPPPPCSDPPLSSSGKPSLLATPSK